MPGDTTTTPYSDSAGFDNFYISTYGDTIWLRPPPPVEEYQPYQSNAKTSGESKPMDSADIAIIFGLFILFLALANWKKKEEEVPYAELSPEKRKKLARAVVEEKGTEYDEWLSRYNPYYASLPLHMRSRFMQRTVEFAQSKEFRFHELEEDESILILISAAAVQLTFGLPNFLMDYFHVIHVIRKEYVLHHDNETYYGHVSRNGIYISWDHFARGYHDYTDGVNVGLHEMAHAISYDVFLGYQDRHDRGFKRRLQEFRVEGGPVFRAMKEGDPHLLDSYAATNFDEFWAVCVETFFETPESLRDEEPGLYATICELLNQDPTRQDKIIDKRMAGIRY